MNKGDNGTLILQNSGAATWTGGVKINSGILAVNASSGPNVFGASTATVTINGITTGVATAAALQISGGITISNPITLNGSGADNPSLVSSPVGGTATPGASGINSGGALESTSGTNTVSGLITLPNDGWIGADAGSVLNLTGGITDTGKSFRATGAGNINVTGGAWSGSYGITKEGTGTFTDQILIGQISTVFTINNGTFVMNKLGELTSGGVAAVTVQPGAQLFVDDSLLPGTPIANRLQSHAVTLDGGAFQYTANPTAASSESMGALTANQGADNVNIVSTSSGTSACTVTFASLAGITAANGGVLNFSSSTAFGTTGNELLFTTNPALTNGILPRVVVTNTTLGTLDFATTSATGIQGYTASGGTSQLVLSNAAAADNVKLTASAQLGTTVSKAFNSLLLNGDGINVSASFPGQQIAPGTGNILVTGQVSTQDTIGGGYLLTAIGGNEGSFLVNAGNSLVFSGPITATNNLTKGLGGTLTFNAPVYDTTTTNWYSADAGLTNLGAGPNTLLPGIGLAIAPGATVDLQGQSQVVRDFNNTGNGTRLGGTLQSTNPATFVVNSGGSDTFAGLVTGGISLVKAGGNNLTLTNSSNYGGQTLVTGGSLTLYDNGALGNTSAIALDNGRLNLDNTGLADSANRLNNAASITMNGGFLGYYGRQSTASAETLGGGITLNQGFNWIEVQAQTPAAGAVASATLTLGSLTTTASNAPVVMFWQSSSANALGLIGSSPQLLVSGGVPLTDNIIGAWAVYNNDWASYTGLGVGALNTTGYAGYDATSITATSSSTMNIKLSASQAVPAGGITINTLNLASNNLTFNNAGDALNLVAGGILVNNTSQSIGTAALPGRLTAGGSTASGTTPLYIYERANTLTIYSQIVDTNAVPGGGSGNVQLVLNPMGGTITLSNTTGYSNTYTGGTVVNGGAQSATDTINLSGAVGTVLIPGNSLVINNATVTMNTNQGQIAASNAVTLNGGSVLTMVGTNTLAGLAFSNYGGTATPTLNVGTLLTLTSGSIAVTTGNVATTATVTGGTLDFNNQNATLSVSPIMAAGQQVNPWQAGFNLVSVVRDSAAAGPTTLNLTGGGVVELSGSSTFTGGVNVPLGTGLMIGASSNPSTVGSTVTSGPLGTGTLSLSPSAALLSSAAANTVANPLAAAGDFTLTGMTNLTLNGAVNLQSAANTNVTVVVPGVTLTLGGVVSSASSSLTKLGEGNLALTNTANLFTGATTVSAGTLSIAADGSLGPAPATFTAGQLTIQNGAALYGTATLMTSANRGITIGAGSAQFGAATGTTMTLTGPITGSNPIAVVGPGTVAFAASNTSLSSPITSLAGTLQANMPAALNNNPVTLAGGGLSLAWDGAGTGTQETTQFPDAVTLSAASTITVGRNGVSYLPLFTLAANKTEQLTSSFALNGFPLTVTNNNGYGLVITGPLALTTTQTFSVGTATASNVPQGLLLSGPLSGNFGITKTGAGTLVLANTSSSFVGNVNITQGVVSIDGNGLYEINDASGGTNQIVLNPSTGTSTLRVTGTGGLTLGNNVLVLGTAANTSAVEVVAGQRLTLGSLNVSAAPAAGLTKNDNGTLVLAGTNTGWTGNINLNAGILQFAGNSALPTGGTIAITNTLGSGAVVQLTGGLTIPNPVNLNLNGGNQPPGGINGSGAFDSTSGTNTLAGPMYLGQDAGVGAESGATLDVTGGVIGVLHRLSFTGAGSIYVSGGSIGNMYSIDKSGTGTTTIQAPVGVIQTGNLNITAGTLAFGGMAGTLTGTGANDSAIVDAGATLNLDNTAAAVNNRLAGNTVQLYGGTLNYLVNGGTSSTETTGIFTSGWGNNTVNMGNSGSYSGTLAFGNTAAFTVAGGSFLNVTTTGGTLGVNDVVTFATSATLTGGTAGVGIIQRALVNGTDFATYNPATGVGVVAYSPSTILTGVPAATTFNATASQVLGLSSGTAALGVYSQTINALKLNGNGLVVSAGAGSNNLVLTSGEILSTGGSNAVGAPIALGGTEGGFAASGGASLTIQAPISGSTNITTGGAGAVTFAAPVYQTGGWLTVGSGTLTLAGGNNQFPLPPSVAVNPGSTLDLAGNSQYILDLRAPNGITAVAPITRAPPAP